MWRGIYMVACNNYLTTVSSQIKQFEDDEEKIYNIIAYQSVLFPLSGICSLITGYLMDKKGLPVSFIVMGMAAFVFGLCSVIPIFELQYLTMGIFIFNRFFFFAIAPITSAHMYGWQNQ